MELDSTMHWDGSAENARRLLFVCTGNTCRSPMAEAVFNFDYADSGYIASSAGLMAEGSPISENALDAIYNEGYRVRPDHISRQLTEQLMAEAHMVLGITSSHAMQIAMAYPKYAEKVYAMPFDIADPFGAGPQVYKACLQQIKNALMIVSESL